MDKIDIILWVIGSGFTLNFAILALVWKNMSEDYREIKREIQELRTSLNRMEGAFYSKDCCMLKDDKSNKQAQ